MVKFIKKVWNKLFSSKSSGTVSVNGPVETTECTTREEVVKVYRLPSNVYREIQENIPGTLPNSYTDNEVAYRLGIQHALAYLREHHVEP